MENCIFCKIANGEIPAKIAYRDDEILAFHDISPVAPVHVLFIPIQHIDKVSDLSEQDEEIVGKIHLRINQVAKSLNLTDYRIVTNNGEGAGQSVMHMHFHLMGGRKFVWPPG